GPGDRPGDREGRADQRLPAPVGARGEDGRGGRRDAARPGRVGRAGVRARGRVRAERAATHDRTGPERDSAAPFGRVAVRTEGSFTDETEELTAPGRLNE